MAGKEAYSTPLSAFAEVSRWNCSFWQTFTADLTGSLRLGDQGIPRRRGILLYAQLKGRRQDRGTYFTSTTRHHLVAHLLLGEGEGAFVVLHSCVFASSAAGRCRSSGCGEGGPCAADFPSLPEGILMGVLSRHRCDARGSGPCEALLLGDCVISSPRSPDASKILL